MIGHARIDENGKITNGKAGDQTSKEVVVSGYYVHSKGWRVFRAKDAAVREKIAEAMRKACNNDNIGYDQYQRNTLYNLAAKVGFDVGRVTTPCETDCSALVRVCCAYAGVMLPDFNTSSEAKVLLDSGAFTEMTGSKYTTSENYLLKGDLLVTVSKGHTAAVLDDGAYADTTTLSQRLLRRGCKGDDVVGLQKILNTLGYSCGSVDGVFGAKTEAAVRNFQLENDCEVDGKVGAETRAALKKAL